MRERPEIRGIVETCINAADLNRAREDVLLLFTEGCSDDPVQVAHGTIPPHNTVGAGHFAFAVASDELERWRAVLDEHGIKVESEVRWERGGRSIYFRDPDNNLVELASPGIWANY
jgi:catechol 2,3-dioxygenase-like lactoylglutathione lyase family enzyme